jgi:hypothetical protein
MSAVKRFDRTACRLVSGKTVEALEALAADLGLSVERGNGKFDSTSFTLKIVFSVTGEDGQARTPEVEDFKRYAQFHGLSPDDLGRTFTANGTNYEICGLKPKSRKYPILGKTVRGAVYKFSADSVRRGLAEAA